MVNAFSSGSPDQIVRASFPGWKGFVCLPRAGETHKIDTYTYGFGGGSITDECYFDDITEPTRFDPPFQVVNAATGEKEWNYVDQVHRGVPVAYRTAFPNVDLDAGALNVPIFGAQPIGLAFTVHDSGLTNVRWKPDKQGDDRIKLKYAVDTDSAIETANVDWNNMDTERNRSFQFFHHTGRYYSDRIYGFEWHGVRVDGSLTDSNLSVEFEGSILASAKAVVTHFNTTTDFSNHKKVYAKGRVFSETPCGIAGVGAIELENSSWLLVLEIPDVSTARVFAKRLTATDRTDAVSEDGVLDVLIAQYRSTSNQDTKEVLLEKINEEYNKWQKVDAIEFDNAYPGGYVFTRASFPMYAFSGSGDKAVACTGVLLPNGEGGHYAKDFVNEILFNPVEEELELDANNSLFVPSVSPILTWDDVNNRETIASGDVYQEDLLVHSWLNQIGSGVLAADYQGDTQVRATFEFTDDSDWTWSEIHNDDGTEINEHALQPNAVSIAIDFTLPGGVTMNTTKAYTYPRNLVDHFESLEAMDLRYGAYIVRRQEVYATTCSTHTTSRFNTDYGQPSISSKDGSTSAYVNGANVYNKSTLRLFDLGGDDLIDLRDTPWYFDNREQSSGVMTEVSGRPPNMDGPNGYAGTALCASPFGDWMLSLYVGHDLPGYAMYAGQNMNFYWDNMINGVDVEPAMDLAPDPQASIGPIVFIGE